MYAHPLEFPYLTGSAAYPQPDCSVEGGLLAKLSWMYPNEPIDIHEVLHPLSADGSVPFLNGWQWIHVPGHSPGQVAFWRPSDRLLLPADAFITVKQDSFYRVLLQKEEICGPPVYLTTDWQSAYDSAKRLAALQPETVIAGHGSSMHALEMQKELQHLIDHWQEEAVPEHGKWVKSRKDD